MTQDTLSELTHPGELRVGIDLGNILLVTGSGPKGEPQAIGTRPGHPALKAFVEQFIAEAKQSGLVAKLIDKHGVTGKQQVAPPRS